MVMILSNFTINNQYINQYILQTLNPQKQRYLKETVEEN